MCPHYLSKHIGVYVIVHKQVIRVTVSEMITMHSDTLMLQLCKQANKLITH